MQDECLLTELTTMQKSNYLKRMLIYLSEIQYEHLCHVTHAVLIQMGSDSDIKLHADSLTSHTSIESNFRPMLASRRS
jgi:hypothetical protein